MIRMTFDEYDRKLDIFEKIDIGPFWPTTAQIDEWYKEPEKFIMYACFLHDANPRPKTNEETYSFKNLSEFINSNLELID